MKSINLQDVLCGFCWSLIFLSNEYRLKCVGRNALCCLHCVSNPRHGAANGGNREPELLFFIRAALTIICAGKIAAHFSRFGIGQAEGALLCFGVW